MDEARWVRALLALAAADDPAGPKLCRLSAGFVSVSGAGVTIMSTAAEARITVCSSDDTARVVEDLQFALGEGPCVDAYAQNRPVGEADLARPVALRWPAFAPAALAAGAAAVFGFPLRAAGVRIGALDLYRDRPGELSPDQFADALVIAELVAREIIALQARTKAGTVAEGLMADSGLRLVVHQATGMIAAQLGVKVAEALVRLRARAYADGVSVATVATAVVERAIRFGTEGVAPAPEVVD